ncbi:hypothetical protein VNO77_23206 [Canavalia gladiata]|uniref:Uncharacterized protein n=1 Tax=Canavalia gladiata TaxID=3824 RepID=A0AAN9QBB0_CANGL
MAGIGSSDFMQRIGLVASLMAQAGLISSTQTETTWPQSRCSMDGSPKMTSSCKKAFRIIEKEEHQGSFIPQRSRRNPYPKAPDVSK